MTPNTSRIMREIGWGFIIMAVFVETFVWLGWMRWLI